MILNNVKEDNNGYNQILHPEEELQRLPPMQSSECCCSLHQLKCYNTRNDNPNSHPRKTALAKLLGL